MTETGANPPSHVIPAPSNVIPAPTHVTLAPLTSFPAHP